MCNHFAQQHAGKNWGTPILHEALLKVKGATSYTCTGLPEK